MFHVAANGARKHNAFYIAPDSREVFRAVRMIDTFDILFDDRPLVEFGGHVMCGRANELHTAIVRPLVRIRTNERRQE